MKEAAELLLEITALSHEFGTPDFVKGGGGNTSCKNADTLWVKPSGTRLSALRPETFVAMDRARLRRLFDLAIPPDKQAREALVKEAMAAALLPGQGGRPSVEAPLHESLSRRYVVHTHAVLVNALTCARGGEAAARRFFPDALWVPYCDPGFTLCGDVNRRIAGYRRARGEEPRVILLENHGVFISGDTPEEIRQAYAAVLAPLATACAAAKMPTTLRLGAPAPAGEDARIADLLRGLLGSDAVACAASAPFAVAEGPLTPDHIVYAKAFPFSGALTLEALGAFRARHGYAPRVIATPEGVYGIGPTPGVAQLALDLAEDGALVQQLAAVFGGAQFLSDAAREFIENWEVEAYRAKQMK